MIQSMAPAFAAMVLAAAASAADEPATGTAEPGRVLAVFAHPDDEVFIAPALARAVRDGEAVTLVFATSGDQGPGVSDMVPGSELASAREDEAKCSANALGIPTVEFLRLGDGTLGLQAGKSDSPARRLAARLAAIMEQGEFDTVVTWGPDGGYGHSDHRMVSAIITQLVQQMTVNRPSLLYPGIRNGTLPPIPEMQIWAQTDPALLTFAYSYDAADLDAATKATGCHKTQFDKVARAGMMALFDQSIWQGAVHFREAF